MGSMYMNDMYDGMTPTGRAAYQLACQYGLGAFYQPHMGNIVVRDDDATGDVTKDILRFLVNNEDWVLGHEGWGTDDGCWFLTNDVTF